MHQPIDQPVDPPEPVRPSEADLAGRIGQMFNTGAYIATGGSRACTMCGVNGKACMAELTKTRVSCCGACMGGNTHPSPKENAGSCREWAESEGLM